MSKLFGIKFEAACPLASFSSTNSSTLNQMNKVKITSAYQKLNSQV